MWTSALFLTVIVTLVATAQFSQNDRLAHRSAE